ncbi:O-antigen ligase family protein [Terriglobus roseus]|uniref:O-Antigen ligase n=1 Tax=Terriglobus roseus TaxID=392734 RepID=A0A1G7KJQ9_9BACT|nr:O-antigen ligase family protein [Terriglobus roseus]SDF37483.1 O-Antigen ligase [Terriglobus roseus]
MNAEGVISVERLQPQAPTYPLIAQWSGFFYAARVMTVLLTVRLLGMDAETGVALSLAANYGLLLIALLNAGPATSITSRELRTTAAGRAVLLYLFVTGVSLTWTVAASLSAAAAFWLAMACDVAIVVSQLRQHSATDVVEGLFRGFVYGTVVVAAIAWLLPAQSDMRLGDEELLGPNQIGWPCALAFFFAQHLLRLRMQRRWKACLVLFGLTLLRSLSKTTIVAFIVAQGYVLLVNSGLNRKAKVKIVCACVAILVLFTPLLVSYFMSYTDSTSAESLTGRLGIWTYMFDEAMDRPWFGHGFHSVWKVIPPFYSSAFQARHAHNELLQQFYAYGVLGIAMTVGIYTVIVRSFRSLRNVSTKQMFAGLFLLTLIRGLADTEAFDLSWPLWLLVLLGALQLGEMKAKEVLPCAL